MKVYAALFPNGKKYIGATSQTVEKRKKDHITAMKNVDNKFYRALNKYGIDNVEFREIRDFETKERMFLAEKVLIERHKTQKNGYNTTTGGEGNPGRILTEENRQRISEGQKKRFSDPGERKKTSEKRLQWEKDNPEKAIEINAKRLAVVTTPEHRQMMSDKMKQLYKDNPQLVESNRQAMNKFYKERPEIAIQISRSLGGKPIDVFKDGEYLMTCETGRQCVRELSVNEGNMHAVARGKRNHTGGYVFKYKENDEKNINSPDTIISN